MLILLSTMVLSTTNKWLGYDDYQGGVSLFDSDIGTVTPTSMYVSSPHQHLAPILADVLGDNSNEIIVADGAALSIYTGNPPIAYDTVGNFHDGSTGFISSFAAADLDDDGTDEIYVFSKYNAGANYNLTRHEYNGSTFISNLIASNNLPITDKKQSIIICSDDENQCALFYIQSGTDLYAVGFDNNSIQSTTWTAFVSKPNGFCFPNVVGGAVGDYDHDDTDEYFVSYVYADGATEGYGILGVNLNASNHAFADFSVNFADELGATACVDYRSPYVTPPLIVDFIGGGGTHDEIAFGHHSDADEFRLKVYNSLGTEIRDYGSGNGILIGNAVKTKYEENYNAVCVLGYDKDHSVLGYPLPITVYCLSAGSGDTKFFPSMSTDGLNISDETTLNGMIYNVNLDGNDETSELLTPYGTFSLITTGYWLSFPFFFIPCTISGNCGGIWEYNLAQTSGVQGYAMAVNTDQNSPYSDILHVKNTTLTYLDDGISNSAPSIAAYGWDPCFTLGFIKTNTSLYVNITIAEYDGDDVNATIFVYYDTVNVSNKSIPLTQVYFDDELFVDYPFAKEYFGEVYIPLNVSMALAKIRFEATDNVNSPDSKDITMVYGVSDSGVIGYGNCSYNKNFDIIPTPPIPTVCSKNSDCSEGYHCINGACIADTEPDDTSIANAFVDIGDLLGIPVALLYMIFMIIVTGAILYFAISNDYPITVTAGFIIIADMFLAILGNMMGFIAGGVLVVISIVIVLVMAIMFSKMFIGNSGSGE